MRYAASKWCAAALAVCTALAAGCDDAALDPEVTGIVDAVVHDNPQRGAPAGVAKTGVVTAFSGTAAGDMHVSLRSTGGEWVQVGSPNGITVNLQSAATTTVHGPTSVPVATYDRVRLTMSEVEVTVQAGSVIEQTKLESDRTTTIAPGEPLVVVKSVSEFSIDGSGTAMVEFDLNAENWLSLAALDAGTVAGDALSESIVARASGP